MRVIHFAPYFPPARVGGVGEFVARLHEALRAAGHESLVVTAGEGSGDGVERVARTPLGWFLATARWAGRAADYDVVHCQAGEPLPLLLALSGRRRRAHVLTTYHVHYRGMGAAYGPYTLEGRRFGGGLAPWLYRNTLCPAHRVVDALAIQLSDATNTISRASAREHFGPQWAQRTSVVYCGVPGAAPAQAAEGPRPERTALLYVGAPGHRKRVNALPFVLERVRRVQPEARLRIVGFSLEREPELRALFAERGLLPHVECAGAASFGALRAHYESAGVLVLPSAYEGLPLVILEAMQCGLPVVATRVSGHPEAIDDGRNGFLVPLDRPEALAERAVEILERPALREALSRAGRRTVAEHFGQERVVRDYLAIYENLCGPGAAAPAPGATP